jgi:hypothetical protein
MNLKRGIAVTGLLVSTLAAAQAPPPVYTDAPLAPMTRPIHFRWGISGSVGYFFPAQAVDFNGSVRFGAQLTDRWGVYLDGGYTAGIGFGGSASATGGSFSLSAVSFWHIAPMAEVDFNQFFIAAGPMLAGGAWAQVVESVDVSGTASQFAVGASGIMPGFDVRLGGTFGRRDLYSFLGGFTLALDVKVMVATVDSVSQTAGPGGATQSVKVGDKVWAVTPMLMLGYDLR